MKLPRTHKQLQALLAAEYQRGYGKRMDDEKANTSIQEAALARRRKEEHLNSLKAVRELGSVFGQFAGEISRAMQAEKDQL